MTVLASRGTPTTYDSSGSTSATLNKVSGTLEGDLNFCILTRASATAAPTTVPTGWVQVASNTVLGYLNERVYYKVAGASEPTSYTWQWAASAKTKGTLFAYYGQYDATGPIDTFSNTIYTTLNTTLRGASVTTSEDDTTLLFFGSTFNNNVTRTTTLSGWNEDADNWVSTSDMGHHVYRKEQVTAGASGDVDATLNASEDFKHVILIAVTPAPPTEDTPTTLETSLALQVIVEQININDIPTAIQLNPALVQPAGEVTPSSFTGRVRGFRLFQNHALEQRDHNNYES
jgi:hypothetical protein